MRRRQMTRLVLVLSLLLGLGSSEALAWGCAGHEAVALLAERMLPPTTARAVKAVLAASPVEQDLVRRCAPLPAEPLADAATWADDERTAQPATAPWHFVNMPRSLASKSADPGPYCGSGRCIVDAITAQFQRLTASASPKERAEALRFVIHLVGDIHQPLHVVTNGDRGGNCFPVTYFSRAPEEDERGGFFPELHGVWDSSVLSTLMRTQHLADSAALAEYLARQGLPRTVAGSRPGRPQVTSWARDAHALARSVAYGRLPVSVPMEPATAITLTTCRDNRDIGHRMLALHERLAEPYEQVVEPAIVGQLRLAAIRLAAALMSAFPG
jgi:nuclease S1